MGAYVNAADPRGVSLLPASVIAEIASLGLNLAGSLCCAAFCSGRFFLGDVHPLFCFFFARNQCQKGSRISPGPRYRRSGGEIISHRIDHFLARLRVDLRPGAWQTRPSADYFRSKI